ILSAGSISSPHILLNSGISLHTKLTALGIQLCEALVLHLPDVRKNLTDHPQYVTTFFINSTDTIKNVYFRNVTFQLEVLAEWQASQIGFLSREVDNQIGFLHIPHDAGVVEGELCVGNKTAHYELIFLNGLTQEPIPDTGDYFSVTTVVLCPLSCGSITINSTDPLEPPLINPNYFS
ncbi:aryl-alcohol oxidase precursor-like protein, partial [Armillaria gallica]